MNASENFSLTLVGTGERTTIDELRGGRALVLDLWHTKCTRCPAALEKLNDMASNPSYQSVKFASCALSLGDGNFDLVQDMCADEWDNLTHTFMQVEDKEVAKTVFGFNAVPFVLLVDTNGIVVAKGDPKTVDYEVILKASENMGNLSNSTPAVLTFDEDF
jgi:hypothetical protein